MQVVDKVQTLPASGLTNSPSRPPTAQRVYTRSPTTRARLFIEDNNPAWNGYDWQSNDPSNVLRDVRVAVVEICSSNQLQQQGRRQPHVWLWQRLIMFHNGETYGTNTPCKIGQTTTGPGSLSTYSCTSFIAHDLVSWTATKGEPIVPCTGPTPDTDAS